MSATKLQALHSLTACLRGQIPAGIDWEATIALANESLTTTNLAWCVLHKFSHVTLPEDVKSFLTDVLARNRNRNRRLLAQLEQAAGALNSVGIIPVLIKGAAILVEDDCPAKRIISDIDILVKGAERDLAINCLANIGFAIFDVSGGADGPVTLARNSDVGMIDVHTKPRGPEALSASDELYLNCNAVALHEAQVLVPSPTFQILHFVLHDQLHNRDYWKGSIDLRHLCDMANILTLHPPVDWTFLHSLFAKNSSLNALASQLIQANRLLGTTIPRQFSCRFHAQVQYWRILNQIRRPYLRVPFICLTILTDWSHHNRDAIRQNVGTRRRLGGKIRGAWRLFTATSLGKI